MLTAHRLVQKSSLLLCIDSIPSTVIPIVLISVSSSQSFHTFPTLAQMMADEKQPQVTENLHLSSLNGKTSSTLQLDELPSGYYRSKNFIGSVVGVCLMAISLYLGFVLPVCLSKPPSHFYSVTKECRLGQFSCNYQ